MKLCITEKPSVARDIAAILGAIVRHEGYFEGNGYCVTWTFGHLCTLKEPHDYTPAWKRWTLGVLPMLPPRFGIKLISERSYEQQFHVIETLSHQADEIINCGDAGQEGELIQRWVMQKAGVTCPVKRLWISSLTDESIREGFANLKPECEFDNLYHAGLSRAIGDWILGMNGTRLYSLKYSSPGNVLSIGRVQTPTLALIVQRQREIEDFKPSDYWELKSLYRDVTFSCTKGRFTSIDKANEAVEALKGKQMTITDVQQKQGRESAPRLFDLTSLQVEANKKWGWTADNTLRLIQSLYEKKVTTYPRVDTTYLSDDLYPKIPGILGKMTPYALLTAPVLAGKIAKSKRIFDSSKVTDHHAIIPTGQSPSVLVGDERKLYHLIALRFIAAFYPDCIFNVTTVMGDVNGWQFKATGKVISSQGWRQIFSADPKDSSYEAGDDGNGDNRILPPFDKGESGSQSPSLLKKTTQPPKLYTEGTLLRAMESAGKTVDEEELREAMKENGIGRPSTRAAIIETLFKRRYIARQRKSITATQAGKDLIDTIHEELLKSAKLTGIWENKLRCIERGTYQASQFIDELKAMIEKIVLAVLSDNSSTHIDTGASGNDRHKGSSRNTTSKRLQSDSPKPSPGTAKVPAGRPKSMRIRKFEQIQCPQCHTGHIVKGHTAYGCSRHAEGCGLRLYFEQYPADLTPTKLNRLIHKA